MNTNTTDVDHAVAFRRLVGHVLGVDDVVDAHRVKELRMLLTFDLETGEQGIEFMTDTGKRLWMSKDDIETRSGTTVGTFVAWCDAVVKASIID